MMTDPTLDANHAFDWAIYADATLAGLSVLIPIPFVDSISEAHFRGRMVNAIARRRQQAIHPRADEVVNRSPDSGWSRLGGCLLWPFRFAVDLVLRLSRKLLYFLTVKKAADALNHYWQRAYLLDYMIRQGYLSKAETLAPAAEALTQILAEEVTSPLTNLARELVRSPSRLIQSVQRARRGEEDAEMAETRRTLSNSWSRYDVYFQRLQEQFELAYQSRWADETLA